MTDWNPVQVKAQLRLTSQRLGQLQQKKDSQSTIIRRDIATLLQQGDVGLARAKAQNLILEDVSGDLLEALEMCVGVMLEHFNEIDADSPSPVIVEAASSIIYAAQYTESKDLVAVRELLVRRLGPDFTRAATSNRDNYVSPRVVTAASAPPPSAANLNSYLLNIANTYGVQWAPEPPRQDVLSTLSELLAPEASPTVDLEKLRMVCANGIPDEPAWLRPRVWKLLWGILPVVKASWTSEMQKQRDSYYGLVRRLVEPFSSLPPPSQPPSPLDITLLDVHRLLSRVPSNLLLNGLSDEPEQSELSPLDRDSPENIRISCASNLDARLVALQRDKAKQSTARIPQATPEIRLEVGDDDENTPEISLSIPESSSGQRGSAPKTLVPSQAFRSIKAHQKHTSALIRLLFIHCSINPGNYSPHISSLLVVLYHVSTREAEPSELAHAEADTFWLFEAMIGEFSELEDEEGGSIWMKRFSERLAWADGDLHETLRAKGLDPALPHYSYRWLAPLLTQTLPLSSIVIIWDALFTRPTRERGINYKLDFLLDFCTSMLIRAKGPLSRVGKPGKKLPSLWEDDSNAYPPPSPMRSWEYGDAFLEGMSMLELYPVEAAGGIDRLLQTASDMSQRRKMEDQKTHKGAPLSLGARLKVSMWKGFTNQSPSPELSPTSEPEETSEDYHSPDEGNDTETPQGGNNSITSRLANSVWRGITNQSSMDVPPTPISPVMPVRSPGPPRSPVRSASPSPSPSPSSPSATFSPSSLKPNISLWNYAEKLKDSNAAATLSKVSSNWRAKAMIGTWGTNGTSAPTSPATSNSRLDSISPDIGLRSLPANSTVEPRRGSLPVADRSGIYSPPTRPAFFRPPRDSWMPAPHVDEGSSVSPESSVFDKAKALQASLASLTASPSPAPVKSGPRPLLLNSSSLITTSSMHQRRQSEKTQWTRVERNSHMPRDSMSSVSSFSTPDNTLTNHLRPEWDSDGPSRKVPLNRRSVSPMAPTFRLGSHSRPPSTSSANSSDHGGYTSPTSNGDNRRQTAHRSRPINAPSPERGWGLVDALDSPSVSSPPQTPGTLASLSGNVQVADADKRNSDPTITSMDSAIHLGRYPQKTNQWSERLEDVYDSSASEAPTRSQRVRSKRHPNRPPNIRVEEQEPVVVNTVTEQRSPGTNSLAVEWPVDAESAATTPTASTFSNSGEGRVSPSSPHSPRRSHRTASGGDIVRSRKVSGGSRTRKISAEKRPRKISTSSREHVRRETDSAAEEGDDEGYDDLLSAYESEQS